MSVLSLTPLSSSSSLDSSPRRQQMSRLRHIATSNQLTLIGIVILVLATVVALFPSFFATHEPLALDLPNRLMPPSAAQLFGHRRFWPRHLQPDRLRRTALALHRGPGRAGQRSDGIAGRHGRRLRRRHGRRSHHARRRHGVGFSRHSAGHGHRGHHGAKPAQCHADAGRHQLARISRVSPVRRRWSSSSKSM